MQIMEDISTPVIPKSPDERQKQHDLRIKDLEPWFRERVEELIQACRDRGVELFCYTGNRSIEHQSKNWWKNRNEEEVRATLKKLRDEKAFFIADCLEKTGEQNLPQKTNSLPGASWHQWKEAIDCVWIVNGEAEWSIEKEIDGVNGFYVYHQEAARLGLYPGVKHVKASEYNHIQVRDIGSAESVYSWEHIDKKMRKLWG